jgi:hypothetical protein
MGITQIAQRTNANAFGHFVTLWQKNEDGVWKVALDVGIDHPQQEVQMEIKTHIPNSAIPHSESASADLEKAQHSFAESLKEGEADAIIDNASDDIRVYRSGQLVKKLPKKCLRKRTQKQRVHHQAPASLIPSILHTNTANHERPPQDQ